MRDALICSHADPRIGENATIEERFELPAVLVQLLRRAAKARARADRAEVEATRIEAELSAALVTCLGKRDAAEIRAVPLRRIRALCPRGDGA
jgi:hypothetical protein